MSEANTAIAGAVGGVLLFFALEAALPLRHCHEADCAAHGVAGPLILIGDALHNFVDGIVITATFVASVPLGSTTALAIVTHEVPQEARDFAILLHAGTP